MDIDMNSVTGIPVLQNFFNGISINPLLLIIIIVVIILYIILFGSLGSGNNSEISGSGEMRLLIIILISLFIVLVIINGFNHFLNIDVITRIKNFFSKTPEIDIVVNNLNKDNNSDENNIPEIKAYEEVYHIPDNVYNYNNARALCKAYGGRLANYKEIENAYNEGGEWCSYGWSEDQMALFPTQIKTWNKLQKIKGHENDCGRPGINGGFIDNQNIRFGVNCYGHKPKITALEAQIMKNNKEFPITTRSQEFQKKVDYWRSKIGDIIVSPFNRNSWSRI